MWFSFGYHIIAYWRVVKTRFLIGELAYNFMKIVKIIN